jgi:hypothetical protein
MSLLASYRSRALHRAAPVEEGVAIMAERMLSGWHSGCVFTRVQTSGFGTVYVAMPGRPLMTGADLEKRRRRPLRPGTGPV